MRVKTLYDRLIVKMIDTENTLKSGLVIPDNNSEKPNQGKVVMVGEGRLTPNGNIFPIRIKVGDTVIYHKFAGNFIKVDGEDFVVIKEDDILAYINEGVE
jgi:chaperonin GroES